MASSSATPHSSGSLYVGDLSSEVTEGMLFEIFNQIGPVASIRVCRDAVTRRSLGYAYVNFHGVADAERALEQMNNAPIKGKLCRIMWSQRDPTMRKSGAGNIFIKNLDKSIDHKTLHDTFAMFGNILSCKVVTDTNGESKGYGFVHYDSEDAAAKAIAKVNGMSIANKVVFVAPFLPKKARQADDASGPRFTNLYVKNLPDSVQTNNQLEAMFAQYGKITSVWLATETISKAALAKRQADLAARRAKGELVASSDGVDETTAAAEKEADDAKKAAAAKAKATASTSSDAKSSSSSSTDAKTDGGKDGEEMIVHSKGFGFVNFESAEQAVGAVQALNNKEVDGKILYVGRAQKKQERESELRHAAEQRKAERISKYQGVNLYVKNLEDSIDDDKLRDEFKSHGTITSCRVMRDDKGISRGFGFVCFATSDEATRAVTDLNGKMVGSKPIYVALAQRKEIRRAQLEQQHARRGVPKPVQGGLTPNPAAGLYAPGAPVFYAPPAAQAQAQYVYPQQMQQMMPRNAAPQQRGAWGAPQQQYAMAQQMQQPYVAPVAGRAGGMPVQQQQQRRGPNVNQQQQQQQRRQQQQPRAVPDIATTMQQMAAAPLDPKRIAELPVESQKLVLGEKLYPLIHASQPELAGKITGMLLDSYFSEEIIHLIETPDALAAKILEALAVLEQHAAKQQGRI